MRIATETNVLETGDALNVRRSTIKTSAKTFRMSIDGIYSDKFGSIVREIAANAWDSHRRAEQTKPFYVHCPNALKPEFFIRDYGVGMTDHVMETVYIVLGESDKDVSNNEVGMWGIGALSPFAYSDQYFISCYDGETVRHYGYGIAKDGIPDLYLMESEPSDEPKGVRIGFSVEAKDFAAFEKAIKDISVAHNGGFESNIPLKALGSTAFKGEGWTCYVESALTGGSGWYARQGCVLYPIEAMQVKMPDGYHRSYNHAHVFVVDCPIGTIQVTTSREAIAYESEVIEYLNQRIEAVVEEIKDSVWKRIKDIESVTEFFDTAAKITPNFVQATFTHPPTGLSKPSVDASFPSLFFEAKFDNGQWKYTTPHNIVLKENKYARVMAIDDISAFFDPSRDAAGTPAVNWLSPSELRRISRYVRSYLEANEMTGAVFIMNTGWTEEFWKACFPKTEVVNVSFNDLRDAVPRRIAPQRETAKPPIRGLALAKAAGEQKPVFEITKPEKGRVAWVSSEQYRRQASAIFKLARRFEVSALYIAAPGVNEQVEAVGINHLLDEVKAAMEKSGSSFEEWYFSKEKLNDYHVKQYISFLRNLMIHAPKAYTLLAAGDGDLSVIAKAAKKMIGAKVPVVTDEEKKAIEALLVNAQGAAEKPEEPKQTAKFTAALKVLRDNGYYNPTCKLASSFETLKDKDQLSRAADAILAIQAIFPASEKFKG